MIGSPVSRGHPDGTSGQKKNSSSSWLAICGNVHYKSGISLGEITSNLLMRWLKPCDIDNYVDFHITDAVRHSHSYSITQFFFI